MSSRRNRVTRANRESIPSDRDVLERLAALERTRPALRLAEVDDANGVDIRIGGADDVSEDVAQLGSSQLADGDVVAVLTMRGSALVLGPTQRLGPNMAKANRIATQNMVNAAETTALWTDEAYDTDDFHDTSANKGRLTVPTNMGGYYHLHATVVLQPNATGVRYAYLRKNATGSITAGCLDQDYDGAPAGGVIPTALHLDWTGILIAGDYVETIVFQNRGGGLTLNTESYFSIERLA